MVFNTRSEKMVQTSRFIFCRQFLVQGLSDTIIHKKDNSRRAGPFFEKSHHHFDNFRRRDNCVYCPFPAISDLSIFQTQNGSTVPAAVLPPLSGSRKILFRDKIIVELSGRISLQSDPDAEIHGDPRSRVRTHYSQ